METGAEKLLDLAYGNHPKSASLKPEGRKVLKWLQSGPAEMRELMKELGLNPLSMAHRKHFFIVLKPLRKTGMVSVWRREGKTLYYLSHDCFSLYLKELQKEAEIWLRESIQENCHVTLKG